MSGYANLIALFNIDETDKAVLQHILAYHPDRIKAVAVTNIDNITPHDYGLCLAPNGTRLKQCPVPVLTLPNDRIKIGELLDDIETTLLQNQYSDMNFGDYNLNWAQSTLSYNGKIILLTERERYLIAEVMSGGNTGQSRDYLLNRIWGYRADLDTHTLETHIYRLRQKIEDEPETPKRLVTIEGGYRLA